MDYENMRVAELKSLAREHGLRGHFRLRKAELIALLQNNPPLQAATWRPSRPTRPPPPTPPSVRFRPDRPRQPSPQGMDWIYLNSRRCVKVDHL